MLKRFFMVLFCLCLAIVSLLIAATHPTGPNTVSFNEPVTLLLNVGILVLLFLLPLMLAFTNNFVLRIISAVYQGFIVLGFLPLILVGFIIPNIWVIIVAILGVIVSVCSIVATIIEGPKKESLVAS